MKRGPASFFTARGDPPPLALARRLRASLGPRALFLLVFVILATANSAGYRYGASDQAFYTPAVMQRLEPGLFPRDTPLLNVQARLTFADETVAALARLTGMSLPTLFAVLYVVTLSALACAVLLTGSLIYRERWTAVAFLMAISLRHGIAKAGTNSLEGYFHSRQLAFACGALALWAFLDRRYVLLSIFIGCAAALHPTTTLWFVVWLSVAAFIADPPSRMVLVIASLAAVPLAWWAFAAGPLAGRLVTMDREWLSVLADKDYLFPLDWPAYAWAINVGYILIIVAMWRARRSAGVLHERETALVAGCLSLIAIFACALVLQARAVALAIQLQPARVFWMLDYLAIAYLVWAVSESGSRRPRLRAIACAAALAAVSTVRGTYIMTVEFPDRPLAEIGIRDDDWGRVMAWARSSDPDSVWLVDPLHAALYGSSVRVAGKRDVFVEALKDSALAMYDRDIAIETRDRLAEVQDFAAMTPARARALGRSYNLDFLVIDKALDLPLVFNSGALRVYRIRD